MENYKLEKEYKVPAETFREAYLAFQKKYIYPKSYIFMGLFIAIAVCFIVAAAKDPSNYLVYLLIMVCLAFAAREWYNPRKIRRSLTESVKSLGEPVYKIGIADDHIDISTVSGSPEASVEDTAEEADDDDETVAEPLPEKTRININEELEILEYDRFFLILSGKTMFYILPKEGFSEEELTVIRKIK